MWTKAATDALAVSFSNIQFFQNLMLLLFSLAELVLVGIPTSSVTIQKDERGRSNTQKDIDLWSFHNEKQLACPSNILFHQSVSSSFDNKLFFPAILMKFFPPLFQRDMQERTLVVLTRLEYRQKSLCRLKLLPFPNLHHYTNLCEVRKSHFCFPSSLCQTQSELY